MSEEHISGWKVVLGILHPVIEFEKSYSLPIILGLNAFVFFLVHHLQPSVLTAYCFVGIALIMVELVGRFVSSTKLRKEKQEEEYKEICDALEKALTQIAQKLTISRQLFPFISIGALILLALIGSKMNNLLMTFYLVNFFIVLHLIKRKLMTKEKSK